MRWFKGRWRSKLGVARGIHEAMVTRRIWKSSKMMRMIRMFKVRVFVEKRLTCKRRGRSGLGLRHPVRVDGDRHAATRNERVLIDCGRGGEGALLVGNTLMATRYGRYLVRTKLREQ